jgi:hypothetical protein
MKTPALLTIAALGALALAPAAQSAAPHSSKLELESRFFRETAKADANGATQRGLASVSSVRSGDRLLFVIRYRNAGTAPITDGAIVSELPARVAIDPNQSDRVEVSVDGGRRWDRPGATFILSSEGRLIPAPGQTPTHVRFKLDRPVAPGASGQAMFRATLL